MSIDPQKLSSLDAPLRRAAFRKDAFVDTVLAQMNAGLQPVQQWLERQVEGPSKPIALIVGVPRCGSTLVYQMLSARLDVGYCSNLMARFYEAPAVGALLQRELLGGRIYRNRFFESVHGVTSGIEEPNEFGYFWTRHLGLAGDRHEPTEVEREALRLEALARELRAVTGIFERSVVFKCMLGAFFIRELARMPEVVFVDVHRDVLDVACSIYRVRQERLGDARRWWSFRPLVYEEVRKEHLSVQIAAQIHAIRGAIDRGLDEVPASRKIRLRYEDVVSDPEAAVRATASLMADAGGEPGLKGTALLPLEASRSSISVAMRRRLERCLIDYDLR